MRKETSAVVLSVVLVFVSSINCSTRLQGEREEKGRRKEMNK
jgi:hypothetical protein